MLERIDSTGEQQIRFVFPAGEHEGEQYVAGLSFCQNPTCVCGLVDLSVVPDRRADTGAPGLKSGFKIDILKRTLDTVGNKDPKCDRGFGRAFVSSLEEGDWALLYEMYSLYKRQIYKVARDEDLDTYFPELEIEDESLMMDFHEILPFAKSRSIELDGKRFTILDQYCVRLDCDCTESAVNMKEERGDENPLDEYPAVFIDYKSGDWRIVEQGGQEDIFFRRVADILKDGDYLAWFRKRHSRLKSLYRIYRQRHSPAKSAPAGQKMGRNEPCPCGSGIKYKKCCLGKQ